MPSLLLVKTSSLGDVVHALPALSDLARSGQAWTVHWMVEEAFACIPRLHPLTHSVVPVAARRWRRNPASQSTRGELCHVRQTLRELAPDLVLDLQGLLKSALLARLSGGALHGYDWQSAREPLATLLYGHRHRISWEQHAVARNRALTAAALGSDDRLPCEYSVHYPAHVAGAPDPESFALLLHASSRDDKRWPDADWRTLGQALARGGVRCLLPAGSRAEADRALAIARDIPGARALAPGPLAELLPYFAHARLAVGVDTGLTHLAAAFGLPTVALFTATDPAATGVFGSRRAVNLGGKGECPRVDQVLATLEQLGAA